jgi:cytochrome c553
MNRRLLLLSVLGWVLLSGCAKSDVPPVMAAHFTEGNMVHTALVFGNLDEAKVRARALAETTTPDDLPDGAEPFMDQMRSAAASVADAWVPEGAAVASGEVANACGSCHRMFGSGPRVGLVWDPSPGGDPIQHMDRHRWAVDRMWDGLMIPSDDWWTRGTEALRELPLEEHVISAMGGGKVAVAASREVHELGHVGHGLTDPIKRAALYGKVMATCVDCHQRTRDRED